MTLTFTLDRSKLFLLLFETFQQLNCQWKHAVILVTLLLHFWGRAFTVAPSCGFLRFDKNHGTQALRNYFFSILLISVTSVISETPYRHQPSPLLYSIDFWPARNSRLAQRETNHYITRCAIELAWPYLAGSSPGQLVIDPFAQHQRFAIFYQ